MRYPIDTETYIAELEAKFGKNEAAAETYRAYIPFVNEAYHGGLHSQHVKSLLAYVSEYEKEFGPMGALCWKIITGFDRWAREAHAQGKLDAKQNAALSEKGR